MMGASPFLVPVKDDIYPRSHCVVPKKQKKTLEWGFRFEANAPLLPEAF